MLVREAVSPDFSFKNSFESLKAFLDLTWTSTFLSFATKRESDFVNPPLEPFQF
jgi:hypothetical protein